MSDDVDLAEVAQRWRDAATLLERVGRTPVELRGWLGPAWTGAAAQAFDDWAAELHRASRVTAGGLTHAATLAHASHYRITPLQLDAAIDALRRAVRDLAAVRIPGEHPHRSRGPVERPATPRRRAPDQRGAAPKGSAEAHGRTGGTVAGWIAEAVRILRAHGYRADQLNPDHLATIIRYESAGNPRAVNDWDHNSAHGTPSMGLMQTIRPTFDRYHLPGHANILNPVDNIIAGARYAVARYGSVSRTPGIRSLRASGSYRGY